MLRPKRESSETIKRSDQMNREPLKWSLEESIIAAGLEATFAQNRHEACSCLTRTLNRLAEIKCISSFEPKKISSTLTTPIVYHFE